MNYRWTTLCLLACGAMAPYAMAAPLTLDGAFAKVATAHPELQLIDLETAVLSAEREHAALRPPFVVNAEVENAFGTGQTSGLDAAELTLTLASVLERGGKLDARRTLAQSRIDAMAVQRETRRLDLLAEAARRYLAVIAADRAQALATLAVEQRQRTVIAARQRLQAGASPESVVLTAEASVSRAELERDRAAQQRQSARQYLAALWGEREPSFDVAAADPLQLPNVVSLEALTAELERTPELAQFADERRIAEARLQLARSAASSDLEWRIGVRRLEATNDVALVGGVSLALGSRDRAQPEIRVAQAELEVLSVAREAKALSLFSTLIEAHGRYSLAQTEINRLQQDVLPKLASAEQAAERAYRAGAISYLEWAQLQVEQSDTRRQQLDAALDAQRALIEIQRLTGQSFVLAPIAARSSGETRP